METGFYEFKLEDALTLNMREFDLERLHATGDWLEPIYRAHKLGQVSSVYIEGELCAIAACVPVWPGVVEVFVIAGKPVDRHKKAFWKLSKQFIAEIKENRKPHRIQTAVHVDYAISINYLERLGFKIEGLMKGYAPDGADHYMCAIREGL